MTPFGRENGVRTMRAVGGEHGECSRWRMLILLRSVRSPQQGPAETGGNRPRGSSTRWSRGTPSGIFSAKYYLGSPWKWTEIWERNRFLTNPHYIYPGIQVVIVPTGPREIALGQEPASASVPRNGCRGSSARGSSSGPSPSPCAVPRHQAGGFRPCRGVFEGGAEGDRE